MALRHTKDASSRPITANALGVELAAWKCVLDVLVSSILVFVTSHGEDGYADGSCGGELGDEDTHLL